MAISNFGRGFSRGHSGKYERVAVSLACVQERRMNGGGVEWSAQFRLTSGLPNPFAGQVVVV